MFLDQERSLYRAFGLKRSLAKVENKSFYWRNNSRSWNLFDNIKLLFAKHLHSHIVAQKLEHNILYHYSLQVWSMPMIHIYAEKVVNFKALSDHTSLTQLVADHTMMHCCLRLSVEKSFLSRKMTTTLCKWEETSQSPGRAHNDRLVISEWMCATSSSS